jgi:ankyrin repeat protein
VTDAESLFAAIAAADSARVDALLDGDSDLAAARNHQGLSAVLAALYCRNDDILTALLDRRPPLDLFEAAAIGEAALLGELVDSGDDPAAWAVDGFSALHLASFFGRTAVVRLLLDRHVPVDRPSRNGMRVTPLHSAAAGGHAGIAALLLAAGADPNARQHGGWTPLHAAAQQGNATLVRSLLEHGADPAAENAEGLTPRDLAVAGGQEEVIALFERPGPGRPR